MADTIYQIPLQMTAGTTIEWVRELSDYPAPSWGLTYTLVKDGSQIVISGTQHGDASSHLLSASASTSGEWSSGRYSYQAAVSDGVERHVVEAGSVEILPDFAAASTGLDDRSYAKRCLDAIEAVIEGRASKAQLEYSIAGRTLKFIPHTELLDMRKRFREEYIAEERRKRRRKTGSAAVGRVEIRFTGR